MFMGFGPITSSTSTANQSPPFVSTAGMNSSSEYPRVTTTTANIGNSGCGRGDEDAVLTKRKKTPFRPAKEDTKPLLQDPILRSDPIETEEAVLMLPPITPKT